MKRKCKQRLYRVVSVCMVAALLVTGEAVSGQEAQAAGTKQNKTVKKVRLNKTGKTLTKGKKFTLKVKNTTKRVKWTVKSGKKKVALSKKRKSSVVITAKKLGTAKVQAKMGTKKLNCKIKVVKAKNPSKAASGTPVPQNTTTHAPGTAMPKNTPAHTPDLTAPTNTPMPDVTATPMPDIPMPSETENNYYDRTAEYSTYAVAAKEAGNHNTTLTNAYACDPYAMEYDGRLYVYMTNDSQQYEATDKNGANSYGYIQSVHIISSDDMVNWTDHGIYQIAGEQGVCQWANCCWAPCAVHKTVDGQEKFYMYFTNGGWQIGVVEADTPYGPWRDVKGEALVTSGTDTSSSGLDPAAFIDDDGTAWLTYGSGNQTTNANGKVTNGARIRKLQDDMISFAEEEIVIDAPYMNEDSGFNKIGDTYYYSYCGDWTSGSDHQMCSILYMTAKNIEGPYTFQGDVLPNCGTVFHNRSGEEAWGNNHHSIVEFQGKYYMFYHTMVLQDQLYCKNEFCTNLDAEYLGYRSTAINELTVKEDGTFAVVDQDLLGVPQIKYFNPYAETAGTVYTNCSGMEAIHMDYAKVLKKDKETNAQYKEQGTYVALSYAKNDKNMPDYFYETTVNESTGKTKTEVLYNGYLRTEDGARMEAVAAPDLYQYSWSSIEGVDFGDKTPSTFVANFVMDTTVAASAKIRVIADSLDGMVVAQGDIVAGEDGKASVILPVEAITGVHDLYFAFDGAVYSFENWKFVNES
ncbi:MAG: family 43 glycosylhydrolase [Eubacteriales bacterium]|nr:family 43 glycosylhydrolase [Eubacteriales bacterium]